MREADAQPDEIAVANDSDAETPTEMALQDAPITVLEPTDPGHSPGSSSSVDAKPDIVLEPPEEKEDVEDNVNEEADEEEGEEEEEGDGFGDDFDDFEEGGQDDDFDDFEDGFQQPQPTVAAAQTPPPVQPSVLPFVRAERYLVSLTKRLLTVSHSRYRILTA